MIRCICVRACLRQDHLQTIYQHTKKAISRDNITPGWMLWVNMMRSCDVTGRPSQLKKAYAAHSKSNEHANKSEYFIFSVNEPYPNESFADKNSEDRHDELFADSKSSNGPKG